MRFDILTIFPRLFDPYLGESILKRAQARGVINVRVHNLRDFTDDPHKTVDDAPYGGGPGMVFKIEPIARAIASIFNFQSSVARAPSSAPPLHAVAFSIFKQSGSPKLKKSKARVIPSVFGATPAGCRVILFSAKGKQFDAKMAKRLSRYDQLILICGRYEGVDERVAQYVADEEISIGPYVLTGGELAALVLLDAVARHIPGVLGKGESVEEKRYGIGVPVYTRPEVFEWARRKRKVPNVLMSGDHRKIEEWRREKSKTQNAKVKTTT